jgi:hypothetical protein
VDDLPVSVEIAGTRLQPSELVSLVTEHGCAVVCLADLPPSLPSKTRYLVKRLRAALPDVRILVGRWAPPSLADESTQLLRDAGADLVASTLSETRTYLGGLIENVVPGDVGLRRSALRWFHRAGAVNHFTLPDRCAGACAVQHTTRTGTWLRWCLRLSFEAPWLRT